MQRESISAAGAMATAERAPDIGAVVVTVERAHARGIAGTPPTGCWTACRCRAYQEEARLASRFSGDLNCQSPARLRPVCVPEFRSDKNIRTAAPSIPCAKKHQVSPDYNKLQELFWDQAPLRLSI